MQTERVTFLTSREHKRALDAFASKRGESVGSVVREATARYISQPPEEMDEYEEALELLLPELERMIPKWNKQIDGMMDAMDRASAAVRKALAEVEATK